MTKSKAVMELMYEDHNQVYTWLRNYDRVCLDIPDMCKMHVRPIDFTFEDFIKAIDFFLEKNTDPENDLFGIYKNSPADIEAILASMQYYEKTEIRAAKLFYSILKNHPFHDGNKRIACWMLQWYLSCHGLQDCLSAEILLILALMVTQSEAHDKDSMMIVLCHVFMNQNHHRFSMSGHKCSDY